MYVVQPVVVIDTGGSTESLVVGDGGATVIMYFGVDNMFGLFVLP